MLAVALVAGALSTSAAQADEIIDTNLPGITRGFIGRGDVLTALALQNPQGPMALPNPLYVKVSVTGTFGQLWEKDNIGQGQGNTGNGSNQHVFGGSGSATVSLTCVTRTNNANAAQQVITGYGWFTSSSSLTVDPSTIADFGPNAHSGWHPIGPVIFQGGSGYSIQISASASGPWTTLTGPYISGSVPSNLPSPFPY